MKEGGWRWGLRFLEESWLLCAVTEPSNLDRNWTTSARMHVDHRAFSGIGYHGGQGTKGLGRLLYHEHILGCLQVVQFSESVIVEVLQSHVVFKVNLVE